MSEEKPFVNVLLLGESGGGKTTFINSFANYIKHENLQEALLHDPEFCISARFVITDQKYNETIVSVGDYKPSSYKAGKSVTQEVTDYIFELNDVKLRLIDTPGVGDSRGVQQDEKNIKAIVTSIAKYRHLNAIAFVLKSNVTVLNEYFKFCIDHLLSQLDEAAYKNVIFILTHSRGTFYRPGETLSVIQRVLEESRVDIPHSKENMFCLDNEAFRYLVARSRGLRYSEQQAKYFEDSWNQSVACCKSLLHYIVGDNKSAGLKPHLIKVIEEIKPKDKLQELFGFLADLSCGLDDNLEILNNFQKGVKRNFEAIPLVYFDKALPTGEAVYVCRSLKCTPLQKIAVRGIDINNRSFCVLNSGNTRLNCIVCNCPIDFHRSKKYLKKLIYETVVQTYEKPSKTKSTKITMLISSYEYELKNVLDVLAALMIYIMQNYNCIEDPFIVYLRNEKHVDYKDLKVLYHKIKGPKETYTKKMKLEVISNGLKNLKTLNWTGRAIKTIFGDDFNINTGVTIEDKVKKIVPTTVAVSMANLQDKDKKNQEFNEKYKTAPQIGQYAIQLINYGRDKPFSYTDVTNSKSLDANQRQLPKLQDALITKHKQSQSPTERIKTQASTSKDTEMQTQFTNQELLDEMKTLKQQLLQQQKTFEKQIQNIKQEFDSIKIELTAKNQDLTDKFENFKRQQENFNLNKLQPTAKYQELIDTVENMKKGQESADLNKLQVTANYEELINTVENMKKGQENADLNQLQATAKYQELIDTVENNTKGQENLCKHIKSVEKKCEVQLERNHKLIKRHNEDLQEEIKNVKEFIQELSKEVDDMKEESIANVETASSISQDETTQEDNNEQPSKFQKLIDDINNLKKFKEAQMSKDEENGEKQQENSETAIIEPAKFKKVQDLSNFKQFKEQKSANENGEFTSEVKRLNEQQDNISKQLEDLKCFIKDVLGNKPTDKQEEVNGGPGKEKMKKKKPNKNN